MPNIDVKRISYNETKPFLLSIHYARRMPCIQYAFGLFDADRLIGVVTYGQPASAPLCRGIAGIDNKKHVLELNRLAFLPGENGENHASILVSRSLKMLPEYTFVVSYADWGGWHHVGYVYQATNFLFTGMTKPRTDKYSESGHARHYKPGELRRQYRTEKYRYVYLVGNKRQKKEMRKALRYTVIDEYPKGESERYDTFNPTPFRSLQGGRS